MRRWLVGATVCMWAFAAAAGAVELKEGDPAPAFSADDDEGRTWSLDALKGHYVVLYFYPKDDTPGCTVEAIGFRDAAKALEKRGAVVLGVSSDDAGSHRSFREKYELGFPLLTGGKALAKTYGVPTRLGFTSRHTFLIGPDGQLIKIYRKVDPKVHAEEVLAAIDAAKAG